MDFWVAESMRDFFRAEPDMEEEEEELVVRVTLERFRDFVGEEGAARQSTQFQVPEGALSSGGSRQKVW